MLITLEQHGIFDQIKHINACQHYLTTDVCNSLFWWTRLCWASIQPAHNSWATWYIWIKFCILIYFNIVQPYAIWWWGFAEHLFGLSKFFLEKILVPLEPHHIFWSHFAYLCIFETARKIIVVYYTRVIYLHNLYLCSSEVKIACPLHDPDTGYQLIYVHHGSCTLHSVDYSTYFMYTLQIRIPSIYLILFTTCTTKAAVM